MQEEVSWEDCPSPLLLQLLDPDRVALRGFSMGGAGVWHTALHYPALWATVEAGAGDTQSHRFPVLTELAPRQQAMCSIFDNLSAWVLNAYNTPSLAYVGEIDGSFRKHVAARQQLAKEGFHFEAIFHQRAESCGGSHD